MERIAIVERSLLYCTTLCYQSILKNMVKQTQIHIQLCRLGRITNIYTDRMKNQRIAKKEGKCIAGNSKIHKIKTYKYRYT